MMIDARSDADLIYAAQAGNVDALGALLERYRVRLLAIAIGILGHGPQAQDAVQETFLLALRKVDTIQDPGAIGGWLHTVTRNVSLGMLRSSLRVDPLDHLIGYDEPHSQDPSPEALIDQLALKDWVWTALSALPETLRVTAILRYFGSSASYDQIAAILDIPVGTVRSRLSEVRIKLAKGLHECADLDHDDARDRAVQTGRHFAAAFDQINRGQGYDLFADAFTQFPELLLPGGTVLRGREHLTADLEEDLTVGVKLHLTQIHTSASITILEATFENPGSNPEHCPPASTQIHYRQNGLTTRIRLFFAPRSNFSASTTLLHSDAQR